MHRNGSLEDRITAQMSGLSPKQKKLARFVLDSKAFLLYATASQTGEKAGTSAATVVRFAQSLGYAGYSEMQTAIRHEMPRYYTALERIQAQMDMTPSPDNIRQQVFYTDMANIERTADRLKDEQITPILNEIENAERILIIGSGLSAAPALFLAHSLKIIGFDARANINEGLSLAADTANLHAGWLLIAIDIWRYARSTVEAVMIARDNGAKTIAITDNLISPLASLVNYAIEVSTEGTAHNRSPTAVMSVLNLVLAALSYRMPEKAMEALQRLETAYKDNNLLMVD